MKRANQSDRRNQYERFVRGRDRPVAAHVGEMHDFYKQLLECATTGELPPSHVLSGLVARIMADAAIHEAAGNFLKADIERLWCAGLQLHFTWGQKLVTP